MTKITNNKFTPREIVFENQQQLQQYLVDNIKKSKRIKFNLKGVTLIK